MKRLFRHITYRVRISMIITFFALIPLTLFGGYYLKNEWKNWQLATVEKYSQMLSAGSGQLDNKLQELQSKLVYVSNVFSIRTALSGISEMNLAEGLEFVNLLRGTVESVSAGDKFLSIRWYTCHDINYGGYTYSLQELEEEMASEPGLYDEVLSLNAGEIFQTVRNVDRENAGAGRTQERFCAYTKITSLRNPDSLIEMSLPLDKLIRMQDEELPEGSIFGICLELSHGEQTFLFSGKEQTKEEKDRAAALLEAYHQSGSSEEYFPKDYYPVISKIDSIPGSRILCLIPSEYVMQQMREHIITYGMIVVLFLLTVIFCSYGASVMLTRKVVRFIEQMNLEVDRLLEDKTKEKAAQPPIRQPKKLQTKTMQMLQAKTQQMDASDIRSIETRIRKLMQSTQEYYAGLEQAQNEKNRLELEILQMRINPHFLYNTLTSIRYQVKEPRIRKSIDSLIHYYRIVLSKGHLFIRIEEELSMLKEYLKLQVFAYRLEQIQYVFEVDEEVLSYTIIKHLLQPIVENALEHGLRSNHETGLLKISAKPDGSDIVFQIEDNGVGMSKEQIQHLFTEPEKGSEGGGYGIYNVQQRIRTYYGDSYGMTFHSLPGQGTRVLLRIPKVTE